MEFFETTGALVLSILVFVIPVSIIFYTMYRIRRKRERDAERNERGEAKHPRKQIKSVKEDRMEKKGISKKDN